MAIACGALLLLYSWVLSGDSCARHGYLDGFGGLVWGLIQKRVMAGIGRAVELKMDSSLFLGKYTVCFGYMEMS
jgi:hypothetical protein